MPVITKITEQRRRQNRRNVFLDGTFAFGVNLNVVARFRLREGLTLTPERVAEIEVGEVRQECFDMALEYVSTRRHSRQELERKLARREYGPAVVGSVLDDLQRLGYVDDAKFAVAKAESSAKRKHLGRRRAAQELFKAGVKGETARRALETVYDAHDSLAVARDLARKQAPRLLRLDPVVGRRRLVGMLLRRGFDYDTIKPVVEEVLGYGRTPDDDE